MAMSWLVEHYNCVMHAYLQGATGQSVQGVLHGVVAAPIQLLTTGKQHVEHART